MATGTDLYVGYAAQYIDTNAGSTVVVQKCPRSFSLISTSDSYYPSYGGACRVNAYMQKYACNYVASGYCNGNGADYNSPNHGCGYVHFANGTPSNNTWSYVGYCPTGVPYSPTGINNWNILTGVGTSSGGTATYYFNKETGICGASIGIPNYNTNRNRSSTRKENSSSRSCV